MSAAGPSPDSPPLDADRRAPGLVLITPGSSRPGRFHGPFSELYRWSCMVFMRLAGWRLSGDWPSEPKAVLLAAPHTSNWDGIYMLAAAGYYRCKLRWMGKKSLTTGPFGWFVKWTGCVPIDRDSQNDVVRQMADAFAARKDMILAVAPEGSRALSKEWKSGFYQIANLAGVPILMTILDYGTRTVRLHGLYTPSGDYPRDLAEIRACYADARGLHDAKFAKGD